MTEDVSLLMWGVFFGGIGMGYVIYGKKQKKTIPFGVGIALCVFPYFISNVYALAITGMALIALPYFVRR